MAIHYLKDMDFFQLKLLKDKKGIFYIREGKVFIYQGADKIEVDHEDSETVDPFKLGDKIGETPNHYKVGHLDATKLDPTKDVRANGFFYFWQREEYFVLCFVTDASKGYKGTVYMLRAGNALESV